MRRKTKPRVVWLPPTNTFSVDVATQRSCWNFASVSFSDGDAGDSGLIEVPLVSDGIASDPLQPGSSLADIESSGYRLRRIVGKLYVFIAQNNTVGQSVIGVTAGLIIRRTDPNTGGSLAVASGGFGADPADIDNSMDPWIWRRSWLLNNGPTFTGSNVALTAEDAMVIQRIGPGQNFGRDYAAAFADGPSIDQKTARIVGPEERLFLDIDATTILGVGAPHTTSLVIIYEMRVLASMRQNIGNRRNASR